MAEPVKIKTNCITVEGGYLREPWVIEPTLEGGRPFISLHHADRKLARCIGLPCEGRAPFKGTTLFPYVAKLRNAMVDRLIFESKQKSDPMGDAASIHKVGHVTVKHRGKEFENANIPKVIEIELPSFQTDDDTHVAGVVVKVFSTFRSDVGVMAEVTETFMDWLCQAIHKKWGVRRYSRKKKAAEEYRDLPELTHPDVCKYIRKAKNQVVIVCDYRTENGVWKRHQRALGAMFSMMSDAQQSLSVKRSELSVYDFYMANHCTLPEEEDEGEPNSAPQEQIASELDAWAADEDDTDEDDAVCEREQHEDLEVEPGPE